MSRESLGGDIKSLEAQMNRWESDPASAPRDRMGNTVGVKSGRAELAAMKAAYKANGFDRMDYEDKAKDKGFVTSASAVSGYSIRDGKLVKDAPAKSAAGSAGGGSKGLSDAEKELNRIRQEGGRIIEQNRTAYEKYTVAAATAQKALNAGAIDQTTYSREMIRLQEELGKASEDGMGKAKIASDELAVSIRSSLGNSFESALFDAKNFSGSMTSIFDGIARQIARKAFIDPLSSGASSIIGGLFKSGSGAPSGNLIGPTQGSNGLFSGIGKMLGFADGGSPPVGVPSIVGERGPEIFVPNSRGTIIPNHALGGGGGVSITQVFNMSPGLQGTVEAEVRRAAPSIAAAAKAAVFSSIERGGSEARLVNRRT